MDKLQGKTNKKYNPPPKKKKLNPGQTTLESYFKKSNIVANVTDLCAEPVDENVIDLCSTSTEEKSIEVIIEQTPICAMLAVVPDQRSSTLEEMEKSLRNFLLSKRWKQSLRNLVSN